MTLVNIKSYNINPFNGFLSFTCIQTIQIMFTRSLANRTILQKNKRKQQSAAKSDMLTIKIMFLYNLKHYKNILHISLYNSVFIKTKKYEEMYFHYTITFIEKNIKIIIFFVLVLFLLAPCYYMTMLQQVSKIAPIRVKLHLSVQHAYFTASSIFGQIKKNHEELSNY